MLEKKESVLAKKAEVEVEKALEFSKAKNKKGMTYLYRFTLDSCFGVLDLWLSQQINALFYAESCIMLVCITFITTTLIYLVVLQHVGKKKKITLQCWANCVERT